MDTSGSSTPVVAPPKRSWRRHSDEFRARVIDLARQPSTAVALANGLNANMLCRWVRESEVAGKGGRELAQPRDMVTPAFVQLPMPTQSSLRPASPEPVAPRVEVEVQRNGATLRASLPRDSCSANWLREVTR